jgi:ribose transport system permease protein
VRKSDNRRRNDFHAKGEKILKNSSTRVLKASKVNKGLNRQLLGLIIFIAVFMVIMSFLSSSFLSATNLTNVVRQSVFIMLLGFGMTFVLSTGGIDLSVGTLMGLCGGTTAFLLALDVNIVPSIAAGLLMGILVGAGNGLMITKLRITPFIATLATMSIGRGVLFVWTNSIPFRNYMVGHFEFLGQGTLFGIQFPIFIAVGAFIVLQYVYRKTKFGRHVVAYGSNEEAARVSGIQIDKLLIKVYALSGLMAAVAGIVLASRLETVHPEMGMGYELDAIAAAIIGGTSLSGGKGTLVGTALGAFILYLISNSLNLLNMNPDWGSIIKGLVILTVVGIEFISQRKSEIA